jgi:hypothetical protein
MNTRVTVSLRACSFTHTQKTNMPQITMSFRVPDACSTLHNLLLHHSFILLGILAHGDRAADCV